MELPTTGDVANQWLAEFTARASTSQRKAFDTLIDTTKTSKQDDLYKHEKTPEQERLDEAKAALKKTLTSDEWEDFRVRAWNYLRFQRQYGWRNDGLATFDTKWARRWVCKRAHDLGWTPERFANFDELNQGQSRHEHRVERIGKKYQWIALRELIARMADNLAYLGNSWTRRDGIPTYQGARQVSLRDIDPSLLLAKSPTQYPVG